MAAILSRPQCVNSYNILPDVVCVLEPSTYSKISNIRRTKPQNVKAARLSLQLLLRNILKPCVKSRMKMSLKQRRQAMLQLHLSDWQFCCLLRCGLYYMFYGNIIIHASQTRFVVIWLVSHIHLTISWRRIWYDSAMFCVAAIFVNYYYKPAVVFIT